MSVSRQNLLRQADAVLRAKPVSFFRLIALIVIFSMAYGLVMGAFSIDGQIRVKQMLFSSLKMPLLLLVTFALSLPSFFVLNTLLGMRDDFGVAVRSIAATQAGLSIVLAGFGPITALWYASSAVYSDAILFNAAMFGLASLAAQFLLRRLYRPLIEKDPRHRLLLRLWLVIYAFVGIQMGWLLRPFIGHPRTPTQFFRAESWGNAYVVVWDMIAKSFGE